jgi:O6-methylguanine-DNA--protein-cysteine methyltransferase
LHDAGERQGTALFDWRAVPAHKVEALLPIPSGHVTSHSDIARQSIGTLRAVRAVGTKQCNPVSWLIPATVLCANPAR